MRPTNAQLTAARNSDRGLILIHDQDGFMTFLGHDETYGEFGVCVDCSGETIRVRCATFFEGTPRACQAVVPDIMREVAEMFGGVAG